MGSPLTRQSMIERIGSASIALTRLIVMIVAITVLLPSAAQAACALWDVSGTWVVDQSNNASCEFRVRQSGTKLTGAATQLGGRGWAPINGTINGDWARLEVKWSNGTRGEYGGKIRLDGETIHGLTYDAFHRTGAQVQWTAIHHFGCAPVPPPAPPPPPAAIPPKAPMNVDAVRENGSGIYVSWSGDNSAEWYVVERRTALSPLIEAAATSGRARVPFWPDTR